MPVCGDSSDFYRRVSDGYRLNDLGANTLSVIEGFDINAALIEVFRSKASVGRNMHSDYCRVGGRTINDWLADVDGIPKFLGALEQAGWFTRGEPAENSRFWRLLQGERAEMFGVFNEYEQQVLRDWIAMPSHPNPNNTPANNVRRDNVSTFRARKRAQDLNVSHRNFEEKRAGSRGSFSSVVDLRDDLNDFSVDSKLLERKLADAPNKEAMMRLLIPLMSPANHHHPAGLMATRVFSQLFG
jgi:hypothetical protein